MSEHTHEDGAFQYSMEHTEEEQRQQKAFIKDITTDCPVYEPDPRQKALFSYLDKLRKEGELEEIEAIPMGGFPASHVDLGYLKDRSEKIVVAHLQKDGPHYVEGMILMLVDACVQRLKTLSAFFDEDRGSIETCFVTKDDYGYYEYRFAITFMTDTN